MKRYRNGHPRRSPCRPVVSHLVQTAVILEYRLQPAKAGTPAFQRNPRLFGNAGARGETPLPLTVPKVLLIVRASRGSTVVENVAWSRSRMARCVWRLALLAGLTSSLLPGCMHHRLHESASLGATDSTETVTKDSAGPTPPDGGSPYSSLDTVKQEKQQPEPEPKQDRLPDRVRDRTRACASGGHGGRSSRPQARLDAFEGDSQGDSCRVFAANGWPGSADGNGCGKTATGRIGDRDGCGQAG